MDHPLWQPHCCWVHWVAIKILTGSEVIHYIRNGGKKVRTSRKS
jgi:hypothetical protein